MESRQYNKFPYQRRTVRLAAWFFINDTLTNTQEQQKLEEIILAAAYDRPFTSAQQSGTLSADNISRDLTVESDNKTAMSPSATAKISYTILPR